MFDNKNIKALSLFDGMSCFQLALKKLNITPKLYYASEICKHAIKVTQTNFPETIQLGDVRFIDPNKLGHIDIVCGESPCQDFSFSGTRKGMTTTENIEITTLEKYISLKNENFQFKGQSYLFWEYIRILKELKKINPNIVYILENVHMHKKWKKVITQAIEINPININSSLLSAQSRKRYYWTNIYLKKSGLFNDYECAIPQPKDKNIVINDILETFETSNFKTRQEFDDYLKKYFLSEKMLAWLEKHHIKTKNKIRIFDTNLLFKKSYPIEAQAASKVNLQTNFVRDKAKTFTAGGNSGGLHSQMDLVLYNSKPRSSKTGKGGTGILSKTEAKKSYALDTSQNTNVISIRGRNIDENGKRVSGAGYTQKIESRTDNKSNALTSVQKDNLIIETGTLRTHKDGRGFRKIKSNKAATLAARARQDGSGQNVLKENKNIRRFTPIECERLQTVPDNYTSSVSDTQRYKMLGNGFTVDVIAYILSFHFNNH